MEIFYVLDIRKAIRLAKEIETDIDTNMLSIRKNEFFDLTEDFGEVDIANFENRGRNYLVEPEYKERMHILQLCAVYDAPELAMWINEKYRIDPENFEGNDIYYFNGIVTYIMLNDRIKMFEFIFKEYGPSIFLDKEKYQDSIIGIIDSLIYSGSVKIMKSLCEKLELKRENLLFMETFHYSIEGLSVCGENDPEKIIEIADFLKKKYNLILPD